jgi:hypothetical protein
MPMCGAAGKFHPLLTMSRYKRCLVQSGTQRVFDMGALALAMFIGLFGFGEQIFGWNDGDGNIRLAIVAAFVFGIIMGWKTKN